MCGPQVMDYVQSTLSRRDLLRAGAAAAVAATVPLAGAGGREARTMALGQIADLTHTASPAFPVFPGFKPMSIQTTSTVQKDGFYANRWELGEHTGTHMDAPAHFIANGASADRIAPAQLFAPLAVIDIRARATRDPDASVTVDDLRAWERRHGRLPQGAAVVMRSGWDAFVGDARRYINADASGTMHFPGFSPEAAEFLTRERSISGVGVDTLSLDIGAAKEFRAHVLILGAGRWGLENLANLAVLPPSGAMLIVGGPKVARASGGPSRVFAVWS